MVDKQQHFSNRCKKFCTLSMMMPNANSNRIRVIYWQNPRPLFSLCLSFICRAVIFVPNNDLPISICVRKTERHAIEKGCYEVATSKKELRIAKMKNCIANLCVCVFIFEITKIRGRNWKLPSKDPTSSLVCFEPNWLRIQRKIEK